MSAGFPRTSVSRISPVSGLGWRSAARRLNTSAARIARDAPLAAKPFRCGLAMKRAFNEYADAAAVHKQNAGLSHNTNLSRKLWLRIAGSS